MRILLVEDDDIKAENIMDFIGGNITRKKSWQSGLMEIIRNRSYDLIILDMSMPRYDYDGSGTTYDFESFAGLDIMKEMKRREIIIPTIVITSFDSFGQEEQRIDINKLKDNLNVEFSEFYKCTISYNSLILTWKEELIEFFKHYFGEDR